MSINLEQIRQRKHSNYGGKVNRQMRDALMQDSIDQLLEEVERLSWREAEHLDKLRKMLEQVEYAEDTRTHAEAACVRMRLVGDRLVECLDRKHTAIYDCSAVNEWNDL